jgi:hypothetical protein
VWNESKHTRGRTTYPDTGRLALGNSGGDGEYLIVWWGVDRG